MNNDIEQTLNIAAESDAALSAKAPGRPKKKSGRTAKSDLACPEGKVASPCQFVCGRKPDLPSTLSCDLQLAETRWQKPSGLLDGRESLFCKVWDLLSWGSQAASRKLRTRPAARPSADPDEESDPISAILRK